MQRFTGETGAYFGYPFRIYSSEQLKNIAIMARLALETRKLQIQNQISENIGQLPYVINDSNTLYRMLKFVGEGVVEIESIRLVNAKLSRVEEISVNIINTKGELPITSSQFCYFQSVQWLRVCKQIDQLAEFSKFCNDFFRGRDIISDLNSSSLLFQKYPLLKYLKRQQILPLNEVYGLIQPYLNSKLPISALDQVFRLNKQDINSRIRPQVSEGFVNTNGQYGYTAFQTQGNMQNTANFQPSFQIHLQNNNGFNQNTEQGNFFNKYSQMNNYNNNVPNIQQNIGYSNNEPSYNNTLNLPMDPSFPNYYTNSNSNQPSKESLKKERQLKQKKQKEQAQRKAKFLQQQSILQKKIEQSKIKEQNQRKTKQEQQRREKEQSQRDRQFQSRRLARLKEQKQREVEIDVFADNQREGSDRETSGRFSNNFGMKVDFGQNEGEQFNYQSPNQLNNSLLRFSKQPEHKKN